MPVIFKVWSLKSGAERVSGRQGFRLAKSSILCEVPNSVLGVQISITNNIPMQRGFHCFVLDQIGKYIKPHQMVPHVSGIRRVIQDDCLRQLEGWPEMLHGASRGVQQKKYCMCGAWNVNIFFTSGIKLFANYFVDSKTRTYCGRVGSGRRAAGQRGGATRGRTGRRQSVRPGDNRPSCPPGL